MTDEILLAQCKEAVDLALKHLPGKHNQKRHGWRFHGDQLTNARNAMRGQEVGERAEYRKRAGMAEPKKVEKKPEEGGDLPRRVTGDKTVTFSKPSTYGGRKTLRASREVNDPKHGKGDMTLAIEQIIKGQDSYKVTNSFYQGGMGGKKTVEITSGKTLSQAKKIAKAFLENAYGDNYGGEIKFNLEAARQAARAALGMGK